MRGTIKITERGLCDRPRTVVIMVDAIESVTPHQALTGEVPASAVVEGTTVGLRSGRRFVAEEDFGDVMFDIETELGPVEEA